MGTCWRGAIGSAARPDSAEHRAGPHHQYSQIMCAVPAPRAGLQPGDQGVRSQPGIQGWVAALQAPGLVRWWAVECRSAGRPGAMIARWWRPSKQCPWITVCSPCFATGTNPPGLLMDKIDVNGPHASPVYHFLKCRSGDLSPIPWNYSKAGPFTMPPILLRGLLPLFRPGLRVEGRNGAAPAVHATELTCCGSPRAPRPGHAADEWLVLPARALLPCSYLHAPTPLSLPAACSSWWAAMAGCGGALVPSNLRMTWSTTLRSSWQRMLRAQRLPCQALGSWQLARRPRRASVQAPGVLKRAFHRRGAAGSCAGANMTGGTETA